MNKVVNKVLAQKALESKKFIGERDLNYNELLAEMIFVNEKESEMMQWKGNRMKKKRNK